MPTVLPIEKKKKYVNGGVKKLSNINFVFKAPADPTVLDGFRQEIFLDRYSLKDEEGKALESYPEQMWRRVAWGISQQEKPKDQKFWEDKFYAAMQGFKFVPAGRILSGAGTPFEVTYYNCYVIPSPADSRGGIMDNITKTVEIQSRAGGVGINLSTLRPRGARVRKVNGTSSGPVNWASLYSTANHDVIQQGGSRRGALMLMLNDWHPDIEEFITVKEDLTKIPGANLSVCVSDDFMEVLKKDGDWKLEFPETSFEDYDAEWDGDIKAWKEKGYPVRLYKTVKAKEIWDKICEAAWKSAEPGVVFIDRYNKMSNTWYFEKIIATNPSLRAGTRILTKDGILPIEKLEGKNFLVKNLNNEWSEAECFLSGKNKQLYKITLNNGKEIFATPEHKWPVLLTGGGFGKTTTVNLHKGNILPFPKAQDLDFNSSTKFSKEQGFMIGWLYGDGWISDRRASFPNAADQVLADSRNVRHYSLQTLPSNTLSDNPLLWNSLKTHKYINNQNILETNTETHKRVFGFLFSEEEKHLANTILQEVNKLKKQPSALKKANGNTHTIQITSSKFAEILSTRFSVDKKEKGLPESIWNSGSEFIKGFVDGLLSSDGFVSKTSRRIVLTTKHKKLAEDLSDLLSFYGVKSTIHYEKSQNVKFPNHKEYSKIYERYDVYIDGYNAVNFAKIFKLSHTRKQKNLSEIGKYISTRKSPDLELMRIASVEKTQLKEDVWDISVHDDTHCFYINHCITGNCGEQGLGPWGVCNLGHLNLSNFVKDGQMDYESLKEHTAIATRFLDNVVDANYYFYEENKKAQMNIRRTGIGTLGLGDALIKMGIRYGSDASLVAIEKIYKTIRDTAYETSTNLAKEKGVFGGYIKEKYMQGEFIKKLPTELQDKIKENGIRNAVILTQAPTGTISLLANVSSGIEPVYEFSYKRTDRTGVHIVNHPLFQDWLDKNPNAEKPDYFVSASELTPEEHVRVQAKVQEYVDSSISKTVNAPNSHTVDDVKKLYNLAYELGCKGVTYFRDGSRAGVLSKVDVPSEEIKKEITIKPRPTKVEGATYKIPTPMGSAFITVNQDSDGNPFEVFVGVGKAGSEVAAMAEAMGRLISTTLRFGNHLPAIERAKELVDQLQGIGGASSVGFGANKVRSLPDAVAKAISMHFGLVGNHQEIAQPTTQVSNGREAQSVQLTIDAVHPSTKKDLCPSCGNASLVLEEGCKKCYSCGYSEC